MDKKSIVTIVVLALVFAGFYYVLNQDQKRYQQEVAAYRAYQDSIRQTLEPEVAEDPTVAGSTGRTDSTARAQRLERRVSAVGALLAEAEDAQAEEFTVENDVMKVLFSTRGGQIKGVTLKDYDRYASESPVELFDPASAEFALTFYLRNGLHSADINTLEYVFRAEPVRTSADGTHSVVMRLPVGEGAWLEYEYLIHNERTPQRDYLVDFNVRMVNMAPVMADQSSIGIEWSNVSYQNERGFKNENMYTTVAYRFPGASSIEELGMSEESKSESVDEPVDWVAFKQQFFSSVFIAPQHVSHAVLKFDTERPGSGCMKRFSAAMSVPYTAQTQGYDFAFYFGPNKYSILRKVEVGGERLSLERLIPLGWGIFGWINRWCVIPVFDFLRNYIGSFGVIILILAVLIRLVISPMTYKSYVSMAKMRLIKPQVASSTRNIPGRRTP